MSLGAFAAGAAVGGLQYGMAKFQLFERENVVAYTVAQAREQLHPRGAQLPQQATVHERYEALPTREHEYYTYVRQGWNGKVLGFRDAVVDLFSGKK